MRIRYCVNTPGRFVFEEYPVWPFNNESNAGKTPSNDYLSLPRSSAWGKMLTFFPIPSFQFQEISDAQPS